MFEIKKFNMNRNGGSRIGGMCLISNFSIYLVAKHLENDVAHIREVI